MKNLRMRLRACTLLTAATLTTVSPAMAALSGKNDGNTTTPIKHVIIIIGENRSYDHLFATFVPRTGSVANLLSKGIVMADGKPGPNYSLAAQNSATVSGKTYSIAPTVKTPYTSASGNNPMPPVMTAGAPEVASDTSPAPFATVAVAEEADYGLEAGAYTILTTGATGLPQYGYDTRESFYNNPPVGPFQITPGITYDDYAASPVHRFYQMFQQMDCSAANATAANPSGCLNDLFPYVEVSIGAGNNGAAQPSGWNNMSSGEGNTSMGFYNVHQGDAPYFKMLAETYASGDNYHQPVKGGTGADSVYLGYASDVWYANADGTPGTPPSNQIENPNPVAGTNNWYTNDGYSGGTYTECSNAKAPGVGPIQQYLAALSYHPASGCQTGHYYLLNNYNPGFNADGTEAALGSGEFTIPPVSQKSIANVLDAHKVSWEYYGEGWNWLLAGSPLGAVYCQICNPFMYQSYVMTNATERTEHLKDTQDLYTDLANGVLPAVAYVKPGGFNDGHPSSSKYDIFEAFVKKIVDAVEANSTLAANTAIMITNDEGGGYYDSGFIQTVDWFGDGTRIPMIVVSKYSKGVGPVHSYGDHASFVKFVEANWSLPKISGYTRDNLPNPTYGSNPYVPTNMPAIDDLMAYFDFSSTTAAVRR